MAQSKPAPLLCDDAAWVLGLSKGIVRLKPHEVGPALFNRFGDSLSGRHLMKLATAITKKHGFARFRYEHGWCHEPNPKNPFEVADHANTMAQYDPKLPKRERTPLKGVFRRTHLTTLLTCAVQGCNQFEDSEEMLTCSSGNAAFKEACEEGLFFHVFRFEDVQAHKEKFMALMASDNMDSELQMAEDEFSMLFRTHTAVHLKRTIPVGKTLDGLVMEDLARFGQGSFSDKDIKAFFAYAKASSLEVVEWQRTWHKFIADPQVVFVDASFFAEIAANSMPEVRGCID